MFIRASTICLTILLLALGMPAFAGELEPPLEASIDSYFPLIGGSTTFTITGPPDADYVIVGSLKPAEVEIPGWGTILIDTSQAQTFAGGTLSPEGEATVEIPAPGSPDWENRMVYFQVAASLGEDKGVTGSFGTRMSLEAPTGARQPEAIAVTPDGQFAYVAHEEDATLSVIDAVTDTLLLDMPLAPPASGLGMPIRLEIDPEGRHLFVIDPRQRFITVVRTDTHSISGQVPVPLVSREMAFDFGGPDKKIFLTNELRQAVLVLTEFPDGTFAATDSLAVSGEGPGPVQLLPNRTLIVGNRVTNEIEFIDPSVPGGNRLATTWIGTRIPWDFISNGVNTFIPTFTSALGNNADGINVVMELDPETQVIVEPRLLRNLATDYMTGEISGDFLAVLGSGSGSLMMADSTTAELIEVVDLNPGDTTIHAQDLAFVPNPEGQPEKIYVVSHFRETVRPVDLTTGPPFTVLPEIALAHSGAPRVVGVDLDELEDGEWLYSTVDFFNGSALVPNRVTCNTCHPFTFPSGLNHPENPIGEQSQGMWEVGSTGPWLWDGSKLNLEDKTRALFNNHGSVGGELTPENAQLMKTFQELGLAELPISPHLRTDGTLTPQAENGKLIFEGETLCSTCHTAPLFIPELLENRTIPEGVGTGLAPANVPSLFGLWASAPYLFHGQALSLEEVLTRANPNDEHGITSDLTEDEVDDLIAYLNSL